MELFRKTSFSWHRLALSSASAALLCMSAVLPAYADTPLAQATERYATMCATQATNMPSPYGEADLKGNPKLADYCKCFGTKFAERALARTNSGKAPSLKETSTQEHAMRNECRKQFGLPQLKF